MSARGKRNAVVAVMAVLACAAVALNWRYSGQEALDAAKDAGTKILGEATLVSNPKADGAESEQTPAEDTEKAGTEDGATDPAPSDEDAVYTGSDYFATARLTRQQARDNAISLLQEAAEQENADQAVANEASEGIQVLASYTLKEAQIENLVTAKGYTDCVAFMGDDSVSVVVSTESGQLSAEDVAKITDITMNETGFPASGIKIMPAN